MSAPLLLDMTRSAGRRWSGRTPSGIDRVCDAYAAHFAGEALAVTQVRGRPMVLDRAASDRLFAVLDAPTGTFRREFAALHMRLMARPVDRELTRGALYLNVGHSDFDLDAHWRWIERRSLRPVYLLHDLIPVTHPHVTTPHKTARHRGRVLRALRGAAGVIVNSHATADEVRGFAGREGLVLPPLLAAPIAGAQLPLPLRATPGRHPTFVSIGTIEKRKNHMLLIRAWSKLVERMGNQTPRLVLAGSWGMGSAEVRAALATDIRLRRFIEVRTRLDDGEVARLLAGARAALLPTMAEGFGLPMVEALRMRVPVIASDLPSFREIGQGIPTLLDPLAVDAWAETIAAFCTDGPERARQLALMPKFRAPSWSEHFATLDSWLAGLQNDTAEAGFAPGDNRHYKATRAR